MSFRLVPKSVTLNDLERRNGRYLFCVISANSDTFRAYCVKVHVRYLISWWVLVFDWLLKPVGNRCLQKDHLRYEQWRFCVYPTDAVELCCVGVVSLLVAVEMLCTCQCWRVVCLCCCVEAEHSDQLQACNAVGRRGRWLGVSTHQVQHAAHVSVNLAPLQHLSVSLCGCVSSVRWLTFVLLTPWVVSLWMYMQWVSSSCCDLSVFIPSIVWVLWLWDGPSASNTAPTWRQS